LTLDDNPFAELAAHLPRAVAFVRSALDRDPNARILIHCVRGVSRSAAVVAAVLISLGWTPERAIAHIARIRPGAQPNIGFVSQLGEYARTLEPTARV
jgi:protein-tyrosine phosphatase